MGSDRHIATPKARAPSMLGLSSLPEPQGVPPGIYYVSLNLTHGQKKPFWMLQESGSLPALFSQAPSATAQSPFTTAVTAAP